METDSREQSSRSRGKPMFIRSIPDEPGRLFPRHRTCTLAVGIVAISKRFTYVLCITPTSVLSSAITI